MGRSTFGLGWLVALVALVTAACTVQPDAQLISTSAPPPARCLPTKELSGIERPATPQEYRPAIEAFMSQGGTPEALADMLREWGVITENWGLVDASHDLNSDGTLDIIVTLQFPTENDLPMPPGQLLVLGCATQSPPAYTTIFEQTNASRTTSSMPQIITIGDMTRDGSPELAYFTERCTLLTCLREPTILGWDASENSFHSLINGLEKLYHFRDEAGQIVAGFPAAGFEVRDISTRSPMHFVIQEGYISRREAGPHRPARYTFYWNGEQYADPALEYPPSNYHIHALREADRMLKGGNLQTAERLYYEALRDSQPTKTAEGAVIPPGLIPWGGPSPSSASYAYEETMLDAYARYRLVLTYTAKHDDLARTTLIEMQELQPWQSDDTPSYYTRLAEIFFNAVASGVEVANPLNSACEQVKAFARTEMPQTFEFLGDANYYGPALSGYTLDDLCPF